MFRSALLRLTAWYLMIIMLISLFFSVTIYQLSTRELGLGFGRLKSGLLVPRELDNLNALLQDQIDRSKERLAWRLFYFNLGILCLAGALSYTLAKKTLQPIEEAHEAQSRFTADASHELRTPLTVMKSEIEVFLRGKQQKSSEAISLLQSNLEEVNKLDALATGLLALSRYHAGLASPQFRWLSLKSVAEEAIGRITKMAEQRQIALVLTGEDVKLEADRASLTELLSILLDNAIKYSPNKATVTVQLAGDTHSASVSVIDQGAGIHASDLPYIFQRFYRADRSRSKEKAAGYGLGLSIAQQIARLHHGHFEVASEPDKGSTFTVRLPLVQPKAARRFLTF
jgi:signal transduction histidine kinase